MKERPFIQSLRSTTPVIESLVRGLGREEASWKPAEDKWCILEVMGHLLDEEREDFRVRIRLTLENPEAEWPPIHPSAWVTEREYAKRDLAATLDAWLEERAASLRWLEGQGGADWDRFREHPLAGRLAAGDLLASWAAHDLLHIRQLARLRYEYLSEIAKPWSPAYAG